MATGLILMSIGILQFTVIPLFADLNSSHASNPDWPGHARTHLVTQVLTTSGLGLLALLMLWGGKVETELGICLAMMLCVGALVPFFVSAATSPLFGGTLKPTRIALGRIQLGKIEGNVVNFGIATLMVVTGRVLLL